jgi:hypothetical protein
MRRFEIRSSALNGPDGAAFVAALKAAQPSLCLTFDNEAAAALATGLSFRFIGFDAQRFTPGAAQDPGDQDAAVWHRRGVQRV